MKLSANQITTLIILLVSLQFGTEVNGAAVLMCSGCSPQYGGNGMLLYSIPYAGESVVNRGLGRTVQNTATSATASSGAVAGSNVIAAPTIGFGGLGTAVPQLVSSGAVAESNAIAATTTGFGGSGGLLTQYPQQYNAIPTSLISNIGVTDLGTNAAIASSAAGSVAGVTGSNALAVADASALSQYPTQLIRPPTFSTLYTGQPFMSGNLFQNAITVPQYQMQYVGSQLPYMSYTGQSLNSLMSIPTTQQIVPVSGVVQTIGVMPTGSTGSAGVYPTTGASQAESASTASTSTTTSTTSTAATGVAGAETAGLNPLSII